MLLCVQNSGAGGECNWCRCIQCATEGNNEVAAAETAGSRVCHRRLQQSQVEVARLAVDRSQPILPRDATRRYLVKR